MIISSVAKSKKKLYLKDPESTNLGKRIIKNSIKLIDELGFDAFNFKKLAVEIESTEASIYRYFENKHKLLIYLISWYWSWIKYNIDNHTRDLKDPIEKLKGAIKVITLSSQDDPKTPHIDEGILSRIVIMESPKSYMTKHVDEDYKDGLFEAHKELCQQVADIVTHVNPDYPKPKAFAVALIRVAHNQLFFSYHLPELTDLEVTTNNKEELEEFLEDMIFSTLKVNRE